jgi:Autotransporter beta-domain
VYRFWGVSPRRVYFVYLFAACAFSCMLDATPSQAQVACIDGVNPGPCINVGDLTGSILTNNDDSSVINTGSVLDNGTFTQGDIGTTGANSPITNSGFAFGFLTTDGPNSPIINSGTSAALITVGPNSTVTNSGFTAAIQTGLPGNGGNGVTNSGTVLFDIQTAGPNSPIINSGTVFGNIFANGPNSEVINSGTVVDSIFGNEDNNSVTNSGSVGGSIGTAGINAFVSNTGSVGEALSSQRPNSPIFNSGTVGFGIFTSGPESPIVNSGSVDFRIATSGDNNAVTNSGSVGSGDARDGILVQGLNPTLTLLPGSIIQGVLEMSVNGTRTLNVGNGLSVANTFVVGFGPFGDLGGLPTTINTFGAPFAVSGNQIAVVDPTTLAMQDEVVVDLTNGIANSVFSALKASRTGQGAGPAGSQPQFVTSPGLAASGSPETAVRYWAKSFGSRRNQDGPSPTVDADHWVAGTVSGVDARMMSNVRAGGFLGGSTGEVEHEFGTQETEIDSLFGGVYAGTQTGSIAIDFAIMSGWTDHDRERQVANNLAPNGLETARADYDGFFVAPELAVSVETGLGLVPSARVRYVNYQLDGFQESGAADNFSVGDRDLEILQGRFQVAMPIVTSGSDSSYTSIEPYVGVEVRSILSGDTIDAVLLGQTLSFDPGGEDDVTSIYAGVYSSARIASNVELFANAEFNIEDDDAYRYGGNIGAKVTF